MTLTRRFQGGKLGLIHCYLSKASPGVGLFFQLFPAYSSVYVPCSFAAESMFVIFVIGGVKHTHTHLCYQGSKTHTHTHNSHSQHTAFLPLIGSAYKVSFSISSQQLEKLEKPVHPRPAFSRILLNTDSHLSLSNKQAHLI